jgi:Cysteine-rich CPXCG
MIFIHCVLPPTTAAATMSNMELIVESEIACPHCGEIFSLQIDTSQSKQSIIEDCAVCCRPITLTVRCQPGAIVDLSCSGGL